jgi:hypothetical protein
MNLIELGASDALSMITRLLNALFGLYARVFKQQPVLVT